MRGNADDTQTVEFTARAACRVCGRLFVWPKGSRVPGGIGPCCQPCLFDDAGHQPRPTAEPAPVAEDVEEGAPARDLGHLGLDDVLCEGCRDRVADGRLTPGTALCVGCAEDAVEHWVAWLVDPSHDWQPTDDVYGSARHPVAGWREMERTW